MRKSPEAIEAIANKINAAFAAQKPEPKPENGSKACSVNEAIAAIQFEKFMKIMS